MSAARSKPEDAPDPRGRYRSVRARLLTHPPAAATGARRHWRQELDDFNEELRRLFAVRGPTGRQFCALAAEHFGLTPAELCGSRGERRVSEARQIAMYVLARDLGLARMAIGELFCRDNTSVSHAVKAIAARMALDPALAAEVAALLARWREFCA